MIFKYKLIVITFLNGSIGSKISADSFHRSLELFVNNRSILVSLNVDMLFRVAVRLCRLGGLEGGWLCSVGEMPDLIKTNAVSHCNFHEHMDSTRLLFSVYWLPSNDLSFWLTGL